MPTPMVRKRKGWDALTARTRATYASQGITRETYEKGEPLPGSVEQLRRDMPSPPPPPSSSPGQRRPLKSIHDRWPSRA